MTHDDRSPDHLGTSTAERGIGNETDAMSPLSDRAGSAPLWLALLAGPVLWIVHFAVVYLASELACREGWAQIAGVEAATLITVVATVVALAAIGMAALLTERGRRRTDQGNRQMLVIGLALDVLFAASVLAVGIPALVLDPC
jgi:hypothetical protein